MMEIAELVLNVIVAGLLVATIIYCMVLDRRIRTFKAEQKTLSGLVGDLNSATRNAEDAVAGLKVTTKAAQGDLGGKLSKARSLSDELAFMVESGNSIATKLSDPSARGGHIKQPELHREPADNVAVLDVRKARREKVEPAFSRPAPRFVPQAEDGRGAEPASLAQILRTAR